MTLWRCLLCPYETLAGEAVVQSHIDEEHGYLIRVEEQDDEEKRPLPDNRVEGSPKL